MPNYRVVWEIDVCADSPFKAAREAWDVMQEPGSEARYSSVYSEAGERTDIDLHVEEDDETHD